jgi:hypothetical protein
VLKLDDDSREMRVVVQARAKSECAYIIMLEGLDFISGEPLKCFNRATNMNISVLPEFSSFRRLE